MISQRKKSGLHVDAISREAGSNPEMDALIAVQRLQRNVFWNVGPVQPVDVDLLVRLPLVGVLLCLGRRCLRIGGRSRGLRILRVARVVYVRSLLRTAQDRQEQSSKC